MAENNTLCIFYDKTSRNFYRFPAGFCLSTKNLLLRIIMFLTMNLKKMMHMMVQHIMIM